MTEQKEMWGQLKGMLPLIEMERQAYIQREHDRLQALMGTVYWDREAGCDRLFHPEAEPAIDGELVHEAVGDPYAITLEELCRMPGLKRRIIRLGTESYITFFHMRQEDRERIGFLAGLWQKLTHGQPCTEEEEKKLADGHRSYMDLGAREQVVVVR